MHAQDEFKYCPVCGVKFDAGVGDCPECKSPLVSKEELQRPERVTDRGEEKGYMYCPRCGAEYDPGVKECGDCFAALVSFEERQRLKDQEEKEVPEEAVVHITGSSEEANEIVSLLHARGMTARVEPVDTRKEGLTFTPVWMFHIVVPYEQEEKAQFTLQYTLAPGWQARGDSARRARETVRRLKAAIEAGEDGLHSLPEFFGEAAEVRIEAVKAALDFDEAGRELVSRWVIRLCREHELGPAELQSVGDACFLLGAHYIDETIEDFAPELMSPDSWTRKNFCFALGKLGSELVMPYLVAALRDPDAGVRSEAIDHLYSVQHTDYGYDPDLEPEEQPEAIARWQKAASRFR